MAKNNDNSEHLFTELFAYARPRARVSREHAQEIFNTLHAEWQQRLQAGKRRVWASWAVAASVALILVSGTAVFMQNQPTISRGPVTVAALSRVVGDQLQLIDPAGEIRATGAATPGFTSGHRLRSGTATLAAVNLQSGGSLRIDENTVIGFNADHSVSLEDGRVYFDSGYAPGTAPIYPLHEKTFFLVTAFGEIRHVGTQFSVQTRADHMVVNVREGEVAIINHGGRTAISAGARVVVDNAGVVRTQEVAPFDAEWQWTQRIIPPPDFDSPRVAEFLSWVGRETGLQISYLTPQARNIAETEHSIGTVNDAPLMALDVRLQSVGLDYEIRDNQVIIRMIQ